MAELHHELPTRLDVDWYRKHAKRLLAAYRAGEVDAVARVDEVLGARAREPLRLSDAHYLIAAEHGFRNWGEFVRALARTPPGRPVGRIGSVGGLRGYEERARELVDDVKRGDADALNRVHAYLPRLADASDEELAGSALPLRDARVVVAREYGFPTWRELVHYVDKANREFVAEQEAGGDLAAALAAIRAGEPERLRALLAGNPALLEQRYRGHRLLEAVAQPDVFGDRLGVALGVDRRCVEVLIEAGAPLEVPLILAACFNRVELIELLLARGANIETTAIWGITPLVSALYHGARETADVVSARKIVPYALWVVAASGHHQLLGSFFDADGQRLPEAGAHRPNLADVGWPPAPPREDAPAVILAEAFVASCHNGRECSAAWLLDRGVDVDARPYLGISGLHLSVLSGYLHLVELLVERGADLTLRDQIHQQTPLQWAERLADRDFTSGEIRDYLKERA
jgi:hypothetical protein